MCVRCVHLCVRDKWIEKLESLEIMTSSSRLYSKSVTLILGVTPCPGKHAAIQQRDATDS